VVERPLCDNTVSGNSRDYLVDFFNDTSYYDSEATSYVTVWETHPSVTDRLERNVLQ